MYCEPCKTFNLREWVWKLRNKIIYFTIMYRKFLPVFIIINFYSVELKLRTAGELNERIAYQGCWFCFGAILYEWVTAIAVTLRAEGRVRQDSWALGWDSLDLWRIISPRVAPHYSWRQLLLFSGNARRRRRRSMTSLLAAPPSPHRLRGISSDRNILTSSR